MRAADHERGRTHHYTNVVSNASLVAVGDTDIADKLGTNVSRDNSGTADATHLGGEGVDDLAGERFRKLEDEYNGELSPGKRGGLLLLLLREQGGFFVDGRSGHEGRKTRERGEKRDKLGGRRRG